MNTPYIKQLDENGTVLNPITKDNPYLNTGESRHSRNARHHNQRHRGNNKGHAIVVAGNIKYFKTFQRVPIFIKGLLAGFRTIEQTLAR